jgi:hypothetical protein
MRWETCEGPAALVKPGYILVAFDVPVNVPLPMEFWTMVAFTLAVAIVDDMVGVFPGSVAAPRA